MATKITQRITGFAIKNADDNQQVEQAPKPIEMNENIARPDFLLGSTYKIKPPISEHALYITINDIILNEGTDHEVRRPYEIFINSKAMEHFQWVIALTRVISAVFRKGGDLRSEEHTSELQSRPHLVCRLLLEKKKNKLT